MSGSTTLKRKLLSPPGDTIQETINTIGMRQPELAERMGKNIKNVNRIIKGKEPITQNTAIQLERVLGIPSNFWLEREKEYRQELAQIEAEESLAEDIHWLNEFPVRVMQQFKWIPEGRDQIQILKNLLVFFGIATPQQWKEIYIDRSLTVAFRLSLAHTNNPGAMSAWLRKGELQAQELKPKQYEKKRFMKVLDEVRILVQTHPGDFKEKLQSLCSEAGVAVVFTPCLPKAPISGASRWIMNASVPLIQLSCRYKTNDTFWFTFYHEAGHILKHGKKDVFLEDVKGTKADKQKERVADSFASEILLPAKAFKKLRVEPVFDDSIVCEYAKEFKTHPAIVAGQLEHEGLVHPSLFRYLKIPVSI